MYLKLDPATLEPDENGEWYKVEDGVITSVVGEEIEGVFIPTPYEITTSSDIDVLGQEIVKKELQILDLQMQNNMLGGSLVGMELRLLALEGGAGA